MREARAVVGGMLAAMEQRRKGMEHHAFRRGRFSVGL
jgi:hypothetical protein